MSFLSYIWLSLVGFEPAGREMDTEEQTEEKKDISMTEEEK